MKHMDTLQKRLIAVLAVLTCIAVFMAFSMYRAIYVNPGSLNTTALSWKNRDIPADMNDVSLVYFTDLEYGRYETHERAQKVFDRIQNMNPRVLIFGGDLFDADAEVTEEMKNQMIQWLSSIPAPWENSPSWENRIWYPRNVWTSSGRSSTPARWKSSTTAAA